MCHSTVIVPISELNLNLSHQKLFHFLPLPCVLSEFIAESNVDSISEITFEMLVWEILHSLSTSSLGPLVAFRPQASHDLLSFMATILSNRLAFRLVMMENWLEIQMDPTLALESRQPRPSPTLHLWSMPRKKKDESSPKIDPGNFFHRCPLVFQGANFSVFLSEAPPPKSPAPPTAQKELMSSTHWHHLVRRRINGEMLKLPAAQLVESPNQQLLSGPGEVTVTSCESSLRSQ